MTLWLLIFLLCVIVFVALIFSSRKNAGNSKSAENTRNAENALLITSLSKTEDHFKIQLADIESAIKFGKLNPQDGDVARVELARELMRFRAELVASPQGKLQNWLGLVLSGASLLCVALAVLVYVNLGVPEQSSSPLATRVEQNPDEVAFDAALERVEQEMELNPEDIRGWQVLAPAYMRAARYDDAVLAYQKIMELAPPTADVQTDLGEALLMAGNGVASPEVLQLFRSAAALDAKHTRSRFYLAAEATRLGQWDQAIEYWNTLLALSSGGEPWLEIAQNGLAVATARGEPVNAAPAIPDFPSDNSEQVDLIRSMVEGLDARLNDEGGSIQEWTRLVRSYLVLNELELARVIYERAKLAYPDNNERAELDSLAEQAGFIQLSE